MIEVRGQHYSFNHAGSQLILPAPKIAPPFWAVVAEWTADKLDQEIMGVDPGTVYRRWQWKGPPIRVRVDTTFVDCNFSQEKCHTDIFQVDPGVKLVFRDCNLGNVSVPDGAIIDGGFPNQFIPTETGNPAAPFRNLLCTCEKCCVCQPVLEAMIEAGDESCKKDGRWQHHLLKEVYREVRKDKDLSEFYATVVLAQNEAALEAALAVKEG